METKITLLLQQKHLLNQIDLFLYSSFLGEEEINNLLELFKQEEADLENLLNKLPKHNRKFNKKIFLDYLNFREKVRDEEQKCFKKLLEEISKPAEETHDILT